jgi:hypothetical protein
MLQYATARVFKSPGNAGREGRRKKVHERTRERGNEDETEGD